MRVCKDRKCDESNKHKYKLQINNNNDDSSSVRKTPSESQV